MAKRRKKLKKLLRRKPKKLLRKENLKRKKLLKEERKDSFLLLNLFTKKRSSHSEGRFFLCGFVRGTLLLFCQELYLVLPYLLLQIFKTIVTSPSNLS